MSLKKSFLSFNKVKQNERINKIIDQGQKIINKLSLVEILMINSYEKLVPFNLWFHHPSYKVTDFLQNKQHLRVRYYNQLMLTPLLNTTDVNFSHIKSFLIEMSLYQPFYPETFYNIWEFLQQKHLNSFINNILHIGEKNKLGSIEAVMFYLEKTQLTYHLNKYHCWLSGKEMYDKFDGSYHILTPEINYLEQAYQIHFIKSTTELIQYDFIVIDVNHLFDNIFKWNEEELDLQANLFYFLTSLKHLKKNGAMLIKMNLICLPSWTILLKLAGKYFKEFSFIRPTISHPFNPEIYLFLNKYKSENINNSFNIIIKNLYRQKINGLYLNLVYIPKKNSIIEKYDDALNIWNKNFVYAIKNLNKKIFPSPERCIKSLDTWHQTNNLLQIKNVNNKFDDSMGKYQLITMEKKFRIKPIVSIILYQNSFYRKLIDKKLELNYFKRIMDTKPSQIFEDHYQKKNNYLITWENLTDVLTEYQKNLKYVLLSQYHAKMVTNAWIKMYEMLNIYSDLLTENSTLKTFHLCEAPGAFISAIGHFLSEKMTQQKIKWDWYAQTLKPNQTNGTNQNIALEDYFGLIASYPEKWIFGNEKDNSGDITHSEVIKSYVNNPILQNIDFMTADGGLLCQPNLLNEQEAYLSKINMGQIICILACLSQGKSAIFKTFLPIAEPLNISMMYLLSHLFDTIELIKTPGSHSYNSEVYVLLKKYRGIKKSTLNILYDLLDDPKITSKTLLFENMDKKYCKSYLDVTTKLIDRQIKSLSKNYYYYYHYNEISTIDNSNYINHWFNMNPTPIIPN